MSWESRVFPLQYRDFLHLKSNFPHLKSNFPRTKSNLPKSAFYFLQRLSAFFNGFLTFFNGFPLSPMAFRISPMAFWFSSMAFRFPRNPRKSIYGEEYMKDCYSSFVFFATHSPSFVIPAKQYLHLTQHFLYESRLPKLGGWCQAIVSHSMGTLYPCWLVKQCKGVWPLWVATTSCQSFWIDLDEGLAGWYGRWRNMQRQCILPGLCSDVIKCCAPQVVLCIVYSLLKQLCQLWRLVSLIKETMEEEFQFSYNVSCTWAELMDV